METQGWLLDVYPLHHRMVLWVRTEEGKLLRFEDPFRFPIYAAGKRRILEKLAEGAVQKGFAAGSFWDRKVEFRSGREVEVLALELSDYGRLPALLRKLPSLEDTVSFFNCDIPLAQYYLYHGLLCSASAGVFCRIQLEVKTISDSIIATSSA